MSKTGEDEGRGFLTAECNDCVIALVATECLVSGVSSLSSVNGLRFNKTGRGVDSLDANKGDWRVSPCSVSSCNCWTVFKFLSLSKERGGGILELREFFVFSWTGFNLLLLLIEGEECKSELRALFFFSCFPWGS